MLPYVAHCFEFQTKTAEVGQYCLVQLNNAGLCRKYIDLNTANIWISYGRLLKSTDENINIISSCTLFYLEMPNRHGQLFTGRLGCPFQSRQWVTGSWVSGSNGALFEWSPGSRANVRSPVTCVCLFEHTCPLLSDIARRPRII